MTTKRYTSFPERGVSLVELLVYITILTFMTVIIMNTLASTTRLTSSTGSREALARSSIITLDRLNKAIKSAGSVAVVNGSLVLDGTPLDLSQFAETGVTLANLSFALTDATTSAQIRTTFTLGGENFYSTAVLRHKL